MNDSLFALLDNDNGLYRGNLRYYFPAIFGAPNAGNPYHNFRHLLYVARRTHEAIRYYRLDRDLGVDHTRAMLIAALFHDFGHPGIIGDDERNITIAIAAIEHAASPDDRLLLPLITDFIRATRYPYEADNPSLSVQILRDADMSQSFDDVWIQQSVFGLAEEFGLAPDAFLAGQPDFLSSIVFYTTWAKETFGLKKLRRIDEARQLAVLVKAD